MHLYLLSFVCCFRVFCFYFPIKSLSYSTNFQYWHNLYLDTIKFIKYSSSSREIQCESYAFNVSMIVFATDTQSLPFLDGNNSPKDRLKIIPLVQNDLIRSTLLQMVSNNACIKIRSSSSPAQNKSLISMDTISE